MSPELNQVEEVLLTLILSYIEKVEKIKKEIIKLVTDNKFLEAKKETDRLQFYQYDSQFGHMKKLFFTSARVETLNKIVNDGLFTPKHNWSEPILISKDVLPSMSSFDKISSSDPKASIYRKLGATIVL